MSLAVFEELVGPIHSRPVPIDWDRVEWWLTTTLPRDFKQLCGRHGALDVGDWFWLRAPVEIEGMPSYDQWLRQSRSVARGLTKELGGVHRRCSPTRAAGCCSSATPEVGICWRGTRSAPIRMPGRWS